MVEFPVQVKEAAEKAYAEWSQAEGLGDDANRARFGRAVRVTAKYLPRLRKEVHSGDLVWYSDATKMVGGEGVAERTCQTGGIEEADELARRWGYGEYLDALAAETEPV